jgi:BirA family biotin operon repressor/biotin-[acetyl-CoA-carboxylase] ligase
LTELHVEGDRLEYAALGLGLNINLTFDEPSDIGRDAAGAITPAAPSTAEGLSATATSLLMALGQPVDRAALVIALLERCEAWYERLLSGESLCEPWAARLDTLGRQVVVALPTGTLTGIAVGVTPEGALIVRRPAGTDETLWAGDVTTLR